MNKSSDIRFKIPKDIVEDKIFLKEYLRQHIKEKMEDSLRKWAAGIILYAIATVASVLILIINASVGTSLWLIIMWYGYILAANVMRKPDRMFFISEHLEPKMVKFLSVLSRFLVFIVGAYAYLSVTLITKGMTIGESIIRPVLALFVLTAGLLIRTYSDEQFDRIIVLKSITDDELNKLCETIKSDVSEEKDFSEVKF